jgi:siroheme synthase (precorrin-2 oxidase/ferrochelatase)
MHSIILTKPSNICLIGGGKSTIIKLKAIERLHSQIVCLSKDFQVKIEENENVEKICGDFYETDITFFMKFQIIYFNIPMPKEKEKLKTVNKLIELATSNNILISITSSPELGNFITPASEITEYGLLSFSTLRKQPKRAVETLKEIVNFLKNKEI